MPLIRTRRAGRRLALGLASGALILATVAADAQDRSFWDQLFRPEAQSAPVQPTYERRAPSAYGADAGYRSRRATRGRARREAVKTRYAALPKAVTVKEEADGVSGKQFVDQKAIADNPTKAILNDRTLRAGDIVVLPSGPKVFTGFSDKRHRLSEFEDVKHSRLVDRKTRQQLLAMMVPVGAMPADQARKVMALKVKLAPPEEIAAVDAKGDTEAGEPTQPRVIMPWKTDR